MPLSQQGFTKLLRVSERLYLLLVAFSFYLLFLSRTGEAHTVWEVLHPAFIPTLFVATSLLVGISLTSEKTAYKLLFIIIHSILIHSFFSMVFPAGDLSGQQLYLGRTRLIYDNAILHGWPPWPMETIQSEIYARFGYINLQAALSVILARMLSIDLLWVHFSLVPVFWGVFTPITTYLTTRALTRSENVAVIASLLLSASPYATYFGAISVPNSLGFVFFFFSFYFMLKNMDSNDSRSAVLMLTFSFFSLLAHYLTGIMSVALLILTITFKSYKGEKSSPSTARVPLVISFIFSAALLPLSLIYLGLFRAGASPIFTLDKFYGLPFEQIAGLFLIGELTYGFNIQTVILVVVGPVLALVYIIYFLYRLRRNPTERTSIHFIFLFSAFLIMLVDYRILKLFMDLRGLINAERLWVFRDFIAAPFVALAIYSVISSLQTFLKAKSPPTITIASLKMLSKSNVLRVSSLLVILNVLIPVVLGGWITSSLSSAYPKVAPLQTTWYELEAVKYIEQNTKEKYVVIGDIWTIFAGEVVVGICNPRAYYFDEYNKTGYDLFINMRENPSPQWMLLAMNYTHTTVAYFIVTEPRLGTEEFNDVVSSALQNNQLTVAGVFGAEKLYVFSYRKG
jgi:hypothetical protein